MGLLGYYYDKIKELENKPEEINKLPFCFACQTVIRDIFYRVRYQENENHEIFKIFFHYFPPCFNFERQYGVENSYLITDGYEINSKYMTKNKFVASDLAKLDRMNIGIDPEIDHTDIPLGFIRLGKNEVTTWIRDTLVNRKLDEC
ncbi:MAG: hypothetical protein WAO91_08365 [Candidatus Nitrosotenuis sp.]